MVRIEQALLVHGDGDGGDLQQRIGLAVETAGLDIDDHRQVAAKTPSHGMAQVGGGTIFKFVVVQIFTHAWVSSRRQRSISPARSGIRR
ncbi:hypothetical protein D3C77_634430 [compost metagenome]